MIGVHAFFPTPRVPDEKDFEMLVADMETRAEFFRYIIHLKIERDKLQGALRELVEKSEALFEAMKHTSVTSRELDGLRQATTKAKPLLGEKGETMDTCLLTDEDRTELVRNMRKLYDQQMRPSTLYKPRVFPDGNMWCALYGVNIQEGVAGFGESPALAMKDFDANWYKKMEKKGKTK